MPTSPTSQQHSSALRDALSDPAAYPHLADAGHEASVAVHETHISWVFLAGRFAYKVKKPIETPFLDYSTLEKRQRCCHDEVRLNRRYAKSLYVDVVPIVRQSGHWRVEGEGEAVEFAVKMHRFPDDALLSDRLTAGHFPDRDVSRLAHVVADFHRDAPACNASSTPPTKPPFGRPSDILRDAEDNLQALQNLPSSPQRTQRNELQRWTKEFFAAHRDELEHRMTSGFIRECHGDLHLGNVIDWEGKLLPFDGIEFNESFRHIDVLSDAAFLAMDFAARERLDLCRSFCSAYLERTGDYRSLPLLRWYLVYRALVRAKVAAMRAEQLAAADSDAAETPSGESAAAWQDCLSHIDLAHRFTLHQTPRLWITHGVSGSGKTTRSEAIVRQHGALRVRSDVERKRHFGLSPDEEVPGYRKPVLYSSVATKVTYGRLWELARAILRGGFSVIVDATFLKLGDRERFQQLAETEGATFGIVHCEADATTLRQRIQYRTTEQQDASDADLSVLEHQLASQEPLTSAELAHVG